MSSPVHPALTDRLLPTHDNTFLSIPIDRRKPAISVPLLCSLRGGRILPRFGIVDDEFVSSDVDDDLRSVRDLTGDQGPTDARLQFPLQVSL